jgi:DNA-binding NarL/FixJ family response regulator
MEAADAVASGEWRVTREDEAHSPLDALDLVESLVSQSLVRVEEIDGGETRFRLLETIREYALERLAEHGETEEVRARHADFYVALAERAAPKLQGEEQADWLDRLEREHGNLRATFRWCLDNGQGERALQLATALWRYWYVRGYFVEGRRLFSTLLTLPACADRTKARAEALNAVGNLAYNQADYPAARAYHEEALDIRRELGDRRGVAGSLNNLALPLRCQGRYAEATALLDEAVRINRAVGNRLWEAICLSNLGVVMDDLGDPSQARARQQESRAIFADLGDEWGIAMALRHLADVSRHHGDRLEARALYEESIERGRKVGDRRGLAQSLVGLGGTACDLGDYSRARGALEEGLAISRALDDRFTIARALEGFAILAAAQHEHERTVRLLSASAALRRSIDAPLSAVKQATLKRWTEPARTSLSAERVSTLEAEGRALSLDQAVTYASEPPESATPAAANAADLRGERTSALLTRREQEVAVLVARGLTNRQIAEELIVGERTVDTHVRNILGKLEFDTRAQIAAWVART